MFILGDLIFQLGISKGAKIRNRYNQVPHLTQDTNGKWQTPQQTQQTRAKRPAPPPPPQQATTKHTQTDKHKDTANTRQNKNIKDPQKKYWLPWNSQQNTRPEGPNRSNGANPTPNPDADQDTQTPGLHERPLTYQCIIS